MEPINKENIFDSYIKLGYINLIFSQLVEKSLLKKKIDEFACSEDYFALLDETIENNQLKFEEQKKLKDLNKISEIIKKEINSSTINSENMINYLDKNLFPSMKKNLNKKENEIIIKFLTPDIVYNMFESFYYLIKIIMDEKNKYQKEIKKLEEIYNGDNTNLKLKVLELENRINDDIKNKDNLKENLEKKEIELKIQKENNTQLKNKLKTYEENTEKLIKDINNIKEFCKEFCLAEKNNKKKYKNLTKEVHDLSQTINKLSISNNNLNNKVSKLSFENNSLFAENENLNNKILLLSSQLLQMKAAQEKDHSSINMLKFSKYVNEQKINDLNFEKEKYEKQIKELQSQIEAQKKC